MKIAVPYENGEGFPHFGHAAEFKIYTAEDFKPIESEIVKIEDASHEAVAGYLKKRGVDLLICDSIGDGAREAVEAAHILLCSNVSGKADEVVEQFLDGSLDFTTGSSCEQHDGGSACGGCCGSCGGCHGEDREPYEETRTFTQIVHLTEENFLGIADIMLNELRDSLSARGLTLSWDESLRQLLVKKAYSTTYGARNLRRTIQRELEDPISETIIDSFEHPISTICITVENDAVKLNVQ